MNAVRRRKRNDTADLNEVCPPRPDDAEARTLVRTAMVRWFSPTLLLQAALRDLASRLFAIYADKRALLAALEPGRVFLNEWNRENPLWFDFVADLGDGWNSTYAIATRLSEPELAFGDGEHGRRLPRGSLLVMGGDQVYPYANADAYKRKMKGPYQAALPCTTEAKPPHLFAIPGNHDWTDGLSTFTRFFCQERWIGGRKTAQSHSYFAIRLPKGWWLWGIDTQLESYIDKPQLEYFRGVASDHMKPGDQVILCLAEPSWVYAATTDGKLHRNVAYLERDIILPFGGELRVCLTGDLHHFATYRETDEHGNALEAGRVKITCGGGGAFAHGTHHLPDRLELEEAEGKRHYKLGDDMMPTASESRGLLLRNLLFPLWNPSFAAALGIIYLLFASLLQQAGNGLSLLERLRAIPFSFAELGKVSHMFAGQLLYSPLGITLSVALVAGLTVFARPDWAKYNGSRWGQRFLAGFIHASAHTAAFMVTTWAVAHWQEILLPLHLPDWRSLIRFGVTEFLIGGIAGAFVFGLYLYIGNLLFSYHRTEAFSSLRVPDFKSFLRMRIDKDGLTIYPIGIRSVARRWIRRAGGTPKTAWFEAQGKGADPALIGKPIHVPKASTKRASGGRIRGKR
jgi:hypothetical protein